MRAIRRIDWLRALTLAAMIGTTFGCWRHAEALAVARMDRAVRTPLIDSAAGVRYAEATLR